LKPAPVSVIVPTVGRAAQLEACLASLAACDTRPAEILAIDQSGAEAIRTLADRFADSGVRYLYCDGHGKPQGANLGLREATHDTVLFTDDDCTVAPSWVDVTLQALSGRPSTIVTGRVLPPDESAYVPSTIDDASPREYANELQVSVVFGNNMAFNRLEVLSMGGFDERFTLAADDNDLCYRWLRAGRRIRYEPEMVVWHHDWRTPDELERLYVQYARFQGLFYAKHLRARDLGVVPFILRDIRDGLAGLRDRYMRGRPRGSDWRQGVVRGLPVGLLAGLRNSRTPGPPGG
jgi:GT2 family glycosyltransferase